MTKPMPVLKTLFSACLTIMTGFGVPELRGASMVRQGNVMIPESSQVHSEDLGLRAHTNPVIMAPEAVRARPEFLEPEREGHEGTTLELDNLYSHLGTTDFRDITTGQAGTFRATKGWDFASGVGSSAGVVGK